MNKKTYLRDGKHWTKEEMDILLDQHIDGETDKTIANVLDRRIEPVRNKRTELMKDLVDSFIKLDNNGLDVDGIEPGEGYFITKEQYDGVMKVLNDDLGKEFLDVLIKENLEKNAIMDLLFDHKYIPNSIVQEAMDAAMAITKKDIEKVKSKNQNKNGKL